MSAGQVRLRAALEELHEASFSWAIACAEGDEDCARDALQDAYVNALKTKRPHLGRSTLRTWLFAIIRNAVLDARRRQVRHHRLREAAERDATEHKTASQEIRVRRGADRARVRVALKELSPREAQVVELVLFQGLKIREAADAMNVSLGSAASYLKRAKSKVKEDLERPPVEPPAFDHTWSLSLEFVSRRRE